MFASTDTPPSKPPSYHQSPPSPASTISAESSALRTHARLTSRPSFSNSQVEAARAATIRRGLNAYQIMGNSTRTVAIGSKRDGRRPLDRIAPQRNYRLHGLAQASRAIWRLLGGDLPRPTSFGWVRSSMIGRRRCSGTDMRLLVCLLELSDGGPENGTTVHGRGHRRRLRWAGLGAYGARRAGKAGHGQDVSMRCDHES